MGESPVQRYFLIWIIIFIFFLSPGYAQEHENSAKESWVAPDLLEQQALIVPEKEEAAEITWPEFEEEFDYEESDEAFEIADPLESWNRAMFTVNDKLYFWVLKPAAKGYSAIVPEWGRVRVRNVFYNITAPVRFVNNLLQLKVQKAGTEAVRFAVNTVAGLGGMFDVARNIDLKSYEEDLGQTLGVYGIGNGFYLVWPFLGSSSLRDSIGKVGDTFLDPIWYIPDRELQLGVRFLDYTNKTSLRLGDYEDMKESAIDPYISFRSAYIQYRNKKVKE
jgi:phospholipid-binding lipoprotein MlaA